MASKAKPTETLVDNKRKDDTRMANIPAAQAVADGVQTSLVELSKSEDVIAGDGTTTVVVIARALLQASITLVNAGIHPTVVCDSLHKLRLRLEDSDRHGSPLGAVRSADRESLIRMILKMYDIVTVRKT